MIKNKKNEAIMKNSNYLKNKRKTEKPTRSEVDAFLVQIPEGEYTTEKLLQLQCAMMTYEQVGPYDNPYDPIYQPEAHLDYLLSFECNFSTNFYVNWNEYDMEEKIATIHLTHPIGIDEELATIIYGDNQNVIYASENATTRVHSSLSKSNGWH